MGDYTLKHYDFDRGSLLHSLKKALGLTSVGVSLSRMEPGMGYPFFHAHKEQEEIFICLEGSGTLLVEDEEMVRDLIFKSLENFGYSVKKAENGKKAINYCKKNNELPIHLLITDVIMPDMSGKELVERLAGDRLGMQVLYISGYTDDAMVKHGVLEEGVNFLQKPFTPQVLAKKVRYVLDLKSV